MINFKGCILIVLSMACYAYTQTFTDINPQIANLSDGSVSWGDYDKDGDLDILVTGDRSYYSSSSHVPTSEVYRNDGNGSFNSISSGITNVYRGSAEWGDYDNDGDLDILIIGTTTGYPYNPVSKIYRNDGIGIFSDVNAGLSGIVNGYATWGDYDDDGDLDILMSGTAGSGNITAILKNENGVYTDINAGLIGLQNGSGDWGDYDNDGDLDIIITGQEGNDTVGISRIYSNDGNNVFTDINAGITGVWCGDGKWGDYDNDGDLDLLVSGLPISWSGSGYTGLFKNEGSDNFVEVYMDIEDLCLSSIDWADYDNDDDLDILLTGMWNPIDTNSFSLIYDNDGTGNFSDINAGFKGVNLGDAKWGDYDNDGDLDIVLTGSYYVDSSTFYNFTTIYRNNLINNGIFTDINADLTGVKTGSAEWCDFDNDNDMDLIICGWASTSTKVSKIYRNDSGIFNLFAELPGATEASWGDYNNDGHVDLMLVQPDVTNIYMNISGTFTDIHADIPVTAEKCGWGDYDNDGDLDIIIGSHVFRNDSGKFFSEVNVGFQSSSYGNWIDYDNDGDLDIFLSGATNDDYYFLSEIFSNDGNGVFTNINAGISGVCFTSADWGDYDNDGDQDLILAGVFWIDLHFNFFWNTKIYKNISGTFTDISAAISWDINPCGWGDYDNDGDLDILLTDAGIIKIMENNSGNFSGVDPGTVDIVYNSAGNWCDFDNDNDLDFVMTGRKNTGGYISKIYRNNSPVSNTKPNPPGNLSSQVISNKVLFSWNKADDNETPQSGLSYNIYIGSASGKSDIKDPMSSVSNGYRKIVCEGNAGQSNSWSIEYLPKGTYYWSVQSIDNCFTGSEFAPEQTFSVTGIEDETLPLKTELYQNYPNPFNPITQISFSIPSTQDVKLLVYNSNGQIVNELVNGKFKAGNHSIEFTGEELNSGIYFYRIETADKKLTRKMLLIK